jgi:hypothetical protein
MAITEWSMADQIRQFSGRSHATDDQMPALPHPQRTMMMKCAASFLLVATKGGDWQVRPRVQASFEEREAAVAQSSRCFSYDS